MFTVGKEYKRKDQIHDVYGGQQQSGISTPSNHPMIFLFTSSSGEQHGYKDEYRSDGIFLYTGEGQIGDMTMTAGNKAIQDHAKNGKTIHVFEYTRSAHVRYVGTADYLEHHVEVRTDREGNDRKVIVFHLDINSVAADSRVEESWSNYLPEEVKYLPKKSLRELRFAALSTGTKTGSLKVRRESAYYRSQAIRYYVVARSNGICEGCTSNAPFSTKLGPFLECHHVHRLADGGPDHPQNVVALCPNCHRRAHFSDDAHSFNERLKIVARQAENILCRDSSVIASGEAAKETLITSA